ncbi:NAD-dependent malate dehydrogenase [Dorcoceras hygrometricum]|uniref:NAD-dependent malate dehydrogenase n=1 Tax=Dorcoceras hygrometricum TaxID=472368 RepID=A0A2Z7D5S7_9LAMI|nr:NAD-dependent malate dehydrogenase [Dorcoceras hygrometricum]
MKRSEIDEATSRKDPDATRGFSRSAKQLKNESAAKQLTIYKSWMSTAERNSNGEIDKTLSTLKMERING